MPGRRAVPGSNQQRAEFVTVQPDCMGLIVQAGAADMRCRGVLAQVFLHRIPVEPGDGAQPPGDGGPGPAAGLQVTGETLDVGATGLEQAQAVLVAPTRVLAQVQLVGLAGQAAVAGQNPASASRSVLVNTGATGIRATDVVVVVMGTSPIELRLREAGPA